MKPTPKVAAEARSLTKTLSDGKNAWPIIPRIGGVDSEVEEFETVAEGGRKDALAPAIASRHAHNSTGTAKRTPRSLRRPNVQGTVLVKITIQRRAIERSRLRRQHAL